jgi:hypothetical protein
LLLLGFSPVECLNVGAVFNLWSKGELLRLPIDVELNLSSSHIDVCICHSQERLSQNERSLGVDFHVEHGKINGDEEISYFTRIFSAIPTR